MKALITGASSGIGEATAELLAAKGYDLILVARREDRLQNLAQKLSASHKIKIHVFQLDVRETSLVFQWVDQHRNLLADVDVLVNNAGLAKGVAKVQDAKWEDWNQMIETNVNGLIAMTQAIVRLMIPRQQGHIINIGSVAGRWSYVGGSVYCGTKFFVRTFSECLRQDLFGTNLRVTNIEPGMVETEFSEVRLEDATKAKAVYQGMNPLKARDVAETIVWCLDRPAHVNIQELVIFPTDQASLQMVHRRT